MARRNADLPVPHNGLPPELLAGPGDDHWTPPPIPPPGCASAAPGSSALGAALAQVRARRAAWERAGAAWSDRHGEWWVGLLPPDVQWQVGSRGRIAAEREVLGDVTPAELAELEWQAHVADGCEHCEGPTVELPPPRKPPRPRQDVPPAMPPRRAPKSPDLPGSGAYFIGKRF